MKLTKFAQSTISIKNHSGQCLIVDPGTYNFNVDQFEVSMFGTADILIVTHQHADHCSPKALAFFAKQIKPPVVLAQQDMVETISEQGLKVTVVQPGEFHQFDKFKINIVKAEHNVRGQHIPTFGAVIQTDGIRIYHASDTNYVQPLELGVNGKIDIALLPFSGRGVTMDESEALHFIEQLQVDTVVPIHYDSPKDENLNPYAFAEKIQGCGVKCNVLNFGQTLEMA